MVASVRRLTLMLILPLLASGFLAATALAATPPTNTSPPTISTLSGVQPSPGQTLVASPGTWTGKPAPSYTYRWYECDYNGANCVDTHQTGSTYAVADSDYAHDLEVKVTATNSAGKVTVTSAPVYIGSQPPQLLSPPTLSGGTQVGDTLTATPGVWLTYPAFDAFYVWLDCDSSGSNCTVTDPADSGPTYTLTAADVGYRVEVTVFVDDGVQASASSAPTAVITDVPSSGSGSTGGSGSPITTPSTPPVTPAVVVIPRLVTSPTISGTAEVGRRLSATPGGWTGSPTSYRYTWWHCRSGAACRQISGATSGAYRVRATDTGFRIAVQVTAGNSAGNSTPAPSLRTAVVPGPAAGVLRNALTKLLPGRGTVVLSHGAYTVAFRVPGVGRLRVLWTVNLGGRRLTVARLTARYLRAGTAQVTIRLTATGRRLLETKRHIAVRASISFAPINQTAVTRQRAFTLST